MDLELHHHPLGLSARKRRRHLRKLSAELERLEGAARAARAERERLEGASAAERRGHSRAEEDSESGGSPDGDRTSRTDALLAAARRREEALQIAIGDCRAEMFGELVRGETSDAPH